MAKFLSMVSPDDVETQILDWGQFQWLNEPRVTGAQKQILGLGRIKPGKDTHGIIMKIVKSSFIFLREKPTRLLKMKMAYRKKN